MVPPMLIWVASFPRSGNSFFRGVLKSLHGVGSYTVYPNESLSPTWSGPLPPPATALNEARLQDLIFIKTHELSGAHDRSPALYVVRDGRDAYVSYAHFAMLRDLGGYVGMSYADVLRMLIESRDHFGGWSEHVNAWTRRTAPTAVLRYEDLLADPAAATANVCSQLGLVLPPPSGRLPTSEEFKSAGPLVFRTGRMGTWKEEMPAELEDLFWSLHGGTMALLGYRREA
jgi:hypothetical protein